MLNLTDKNGKGDKPMNNFDNIQSRLSLILTKEDMNRLKFRERKGEKEIIADVHGMKCNKAKIFINNIVNLVREAVRVIVIHGYNHGTAIKEMINNEYKNPHINKIISDRYNMGRTDILINF